MATTEHRQDKREDPVLREARARVRARRGEVTRRAIVEAARDLFGEQGYPGATVKDLAARSGVAIQTIYAAFGSKAGVLLALVDAADEEAGVPALFQGLGETDDPVQGLAGFARIRRRIRERCGDVVGCLRSAALLDADAATAWMEGLRRRYEGLAFLVALLARSDALRPGLSPRRATDIAAALASDDVADVLVLQRSWTWDEYEAWLAAALRRELLDGAGEAGGE